MTEVVNVHAAKTHFSKLLRRVESGEEVVLARAGKPCARLVPYEQNRPKRRAGLLRGLEIPPEFFEPLPDDELAAWESE
ncbi:type II toxin-antitoxin system Phd/YefM family antitoxin [Candidatus Poriferisodalis sp.]|uniref:type II toxin-antitoxin system Phd/YefM family antitoxin n=1 Tax=Candidatus Poriferisodalis sp. TaxID=3101277 RepID=UPI003B5A49B4